MEFLRERIQEFEERYEVDVTEFGKILLVASTALFVVSVQSAISFHSTSQQLTTVSESFEETSVMINEEGFNNSLEALQTVEGTEIAPRFLQAAETFRNAQDSLSELDSAQQEIESSYNLYRWLVLLSILGMVSGVGIIYI